MMIVNNEGDNVVWATRIIEARSIFSLLEDYLTNGHATTCFAYYPEGVSYLGAEEIAPEYRGQTEAED